MRHFVGSPYEKIKELKKGLVATFLTLAQLTTRVLTLGPFWLARLILTFLESCRSVPGSEIYIIPHTIPSSIMVTSLWGHLKKRAREKKKLACIEFFCLAYNDQCQNCRLLSLIVWPSYLCRSLRNRVSHRYWSKGAKLSRSLATHEISFLITALQI